MPRILIARATQLHPNPLNVFCQWPPSGPWYTFVCELAMFSSDGCTATLAACDLQKINDYIDQRLSPVSQRLKEKLFAATIVVDAKLPATVVALDSLVTLREESTRVTTQLRLVEPDRQSV